MPKLFYLNARRDTSPTSSTRPRTWIIWAPILNPNFTGQTAYPWMNAPNFWNDTSSRKVRYSLIRMNCWHISWTTRMYWSRHAARLEICFLKLVKTDPFREAITILCFCNKDFRTMCLKSDTVHYPERGLPCGNLQSVQGLQWLAYIGRTRKIIHAGNGREVRLAGYKTWKLIRTVKRRMKSEYLGCCGMSVFACPIDINPSAILMRHCRTGMKKQWRGRKNQRRW